MRKVPLAKICGIRSVSTLESICHLPIDYIGFIFAPSRRQISAEEAAEMIEWMQKNDSGFRPKTVGVFVNPSIEALEACLRVAPLDVIQLHGQESPDFCKLVRERFGVQVFKAFSVPANAALHPTKNINSTILDALLRELDSFKGIIDAMLLDTYDPIQGGGSGRTFSWETIPTIHAWAKQNDCPLFIAGGLSLDNVGRLILDYEPDGVDVSSGVETDGAKDPKKIQSFIERVK